MRAVSQTDDDDDIQQCEACDARGPIESYTMMEDCWFCPSCTAEWEETFSTCQHEWVPATNQHGEASGYCHRCAGIVAIEDFPRLGFDPATVPAEA